MADDTTPSPPAHHLAGFPLVRLMARGWWVFVLRGVAAILFGILAFLFPGLGLVFILAFLAAWMVVDGVGSIYQAVNHGPDTAGRSRTWLWIDGIIALGAAAVVLFMPGIAGLGLVIVAGAWFLLAGITRLVLAFRLSSILLGILGALNILIGAWLIARPGPGLLAVIWLIALEAIVMGALMIGLGFRLRRIHDDPHHREGQTRI
ncbi:MAG: HdeD family acid-resistance protein [Acetobacteraceae bacterium]|nr:HdeD family acid-resistance protein [Acetobacteraceae bacterium]